MRPTIIGAPPPAAPGPAVAASLPAPPPSPPPRPVMPTVIPATLAPAAPPAPAPLRPTRIAPAAAAAPAARAAAAPSPANPVTKLLGVERKGLLVDAALLRQRHAGASDAAVDEAAALLAGVVPGHQPLLAIEQLGRAAQDNVARLVERALGVVDDEAARTAGRHTERLLALLNDLADVLRPSGLPFWRKSWRQTLAELRPEIDALRGLLAHSEAALLDRREQLLAMQDDAGRVLDRLDGTLIAVAELRPLFDDPRRLDSLDNRETEIARSVALLQTHRLQTQHLASDFTRLAQAIRDAVLHALPAWLSAAGALPNDGLTDTQRYTLSDQLHALMRSLSSRR